MPESSIQLQDIGASRKLGLKGSGAEPCLREQGIVPPSEILGAAQFSNGGWIVRLGAAEFFLERGDFGHAWDRLESKLSSHPPGVYRIPRSEATLLLTGADSKLLLAQTCGIDFRKAELHKVVYSRVAGVSCGILPECADELRFRVWVDYTYFPYLWETLAEITSELGGVVSQRKPPDWPASQDRVGGRGVASALA